MSLIAKINKSRFLVIVGILLLSTIVSVLIFSTNFGRNIHYSLSNLLYSGHEASSEIVVVGIDDNSFEKLGRYNDWSRDYFAQTINNLKEAGAKVIGVDILFTEKSSGIPFNETLNLLEEHGTDRKADGLISSLANYVTGTHPSDRALADAINDRVVLAKSGLFTTENQIISKNSFKLLEDSTNYLGYINVKFDSDNFFRRFPLSYESAEGDTLHNFSSQIYRAYKDIESGAELDIEVPLKNSEMMINFAGPAYSYKYFSFADIYNNIVPSFELNNKIVLIGPVSLGLQDVHPVPTIEDNILMPGIEIHANTIQTLLDRSFLVEQDNFSVIVVSLIGALVLILFMSKVPMMYSPFFFIIEVCLFFVGAKIAFMNGLIMNMFVPFATLLLAFVFYLAYRYFIEEGRKREIKSAFKHYVSPEVVEEISKSPEKLQLGGVKQVVTVLFTDIISFTTLAEKMKPEELVPQLNEYFDLMAKIVIRNGGTLDKFEGDAVMAFYGAPIKSEDHAFKACKTAMEMRKVIKWLHDKWKKEGKPLFDFRVGISTGEAMVGNMGSSERFDYTVIGDTVNLAARLEHANNEFETRVLVNETTQEMAKSQFVFREIGEINVKGKEQAVKVFELISD